MSAISPASPGQEAPRRNALGQPIGAALPDWQPRKLPQARVLAGRTCRLEPLDPERHLASLWDAIGLDAEGRIWTYLPYGPFESREALGQSMRDVCGGSDPLFFAIVNSATGGAEGFGSYLRIDPDVGSIEIGHLLFTPALQQSTRATEALFLLLDHALGELDYRRMEWKCDALNAASRRAAERLGFQAEGVFRQATLYKGRSRDTAWFSILDSEWPALCERFRAWLAPPNFDSAGRQLSPLRNRAEEHEPRPT